MDKFEKCYAEVKVPKKFIKWGFKKEWHFKLMIWYLYIKACWEYRKYYGLKKGGANEQNFEA